MQDYKQEFIELALRLEVLRFGEFTLKSGRQSPYFFNSGLFNDGHSLRRLAGYYLAAVEQAGVPFDMLFGPAYKGIPLAGAVAIACDEQLGRAVPYAFDRKEEKDHGEGGTTLGAPLAGRVLIIDDVITAGTSVNHAVGIIRDAGAAPAGVAIALDRQEVGKTERSAVQEVEQLHGIRVISIITLADLIRYLETSGGSAERLSAIRRYRERYGIEAAD